MRFRFVPLGALTGLALLGLAPAPADIVVLNTGQRLEGRAEAVVGTKDSVAFTQYSGRIMLPKSRIKEVIEQDDATDFTLLGNQFLKSRSYETAVQQFQKALAADPAHEGAKAGLDSARAMISEQQAQNARQVAADNADTLSTARRALEEERFSDAERLIDRVLQRNPDAELETAATLLRRDLYLAWGLSRIDRLDPIGGEEYLNKVLELDPGNAEARDYLLTVWEKDSSKREQVLAAYTDKLSRDPDDLTMNQKVADLLLALNRPEEAVAPLKKLVDSANFRALRYDQKLMNAMQSSADRQAGRGELDNAIATWQDLLSIFPRADATTLAYLEYEKRLQGLEADDWTGRAALLKDLERSGLKQYAYQEAEYIVSNDAENAEALAYLRKQAEEKLAEVTAAMGQGDYLVARDLAREFARTNTRFPDLLQAAADLYSKSDLEAQRQARRVREEAKQIASRADEYFNEARRNAELMKNREQSDRTTVLSHKQEAIKYAARAIDSYKVALQIDPTLGPLTGLDLNNKLADAQSLYSSLTAAPLQIPTRQRRPRVAQPTGE